MKRKCKSFGAPPTPSAHYNRVSSLSAADSLIVWAMQGGAFMLQYFTAPQTSHWWQRFGFPLTTQQLARLRTRPSCSVKSLELQLFTRQELSILALAARVTVTPCNSVNVRLSLTNYLLTLSHPKCHAW